MIHLTTKSVFRYNTHAYNTTTNLVSSSQEYTYLLIIINNYPFLGCPRVLNPVQCLICISQPCKGQPMESGVYKSSLLVLLDYIAIPVDQLRSHRVPFVWQLLYPHFFMLFGMPVQMSSANP